MNKIKTVLVICVILLANVLYYGSELKIPFYHMTGCEVCEDVKKNLVPKIKEKYKDSIEFVFINIDSTDNYEKLLTLEEKYKDTDNDVPVVEINNKLLGNEEEVKGNLMKEVEIAVSKIRGEE